MVLSEQLKANLSNHRVPVAWVPLQLCLQCATHPLFFSVNSSATATIMVSFLSSSSNSKVTWPRHPVQLPVLSRGSFEHPDSETISIRRLIETRCPSVLTPFKPAWWLFKYLLHSSCFLFSTSHPMKWSLADRVLRIW
jgi:hypothetical protein